MNCGKYFSQYGIYLFLLLLVLNIWIYVQLNGFLQTWELGCYGLRVFFFGQLDDSWGLIEMKCWQRHFIGFTVHMCEHATLRVSQCDTKLLIVWLIVWYIRQFIWLELSDSCNGLANKVVYLPSVGFKIYWQLFCFRK